MDIDQEIASYRRAVKNKTDAEILSFKLQEENKRDDGSKSLLQIACEMELFDRSIGRQAEANPKPIATVETTNDKKWSRSDRLAVLGIIIAVLLGLSSIPLFSEWIKNP